MNQTFVDILSPYSPSISKELIFKNYDVIKFSNNFSYSIKKGLDLLDKLSIGNMIIKEKLTYKGKLLEEYINENYYSLKEELSRKIEMTSLRDLEKALTIKLSDKAFFINTFSEFINTIFKNKLIDFEKKQQELEKNKDKSLKDSFEHISQNLVDTQTKIKDIGIIYEEDYDEVVFVKFLNFSFLADDKVTFSFENPERIPLFENLYFYSGKNELCEFRFDGETFTVTKKIKVFPDVEKELCSYIFTDTEKSYLTFDKTVKNAEKVLEEKIYRRKTVNVNSGIIKETGLIMKPLNKIPGLFIGKENIMFVSLEGVTYWPSKEKETEIFYKTFIDLSKMEKEKLYITDKIFVGDYKIIYKKNV